MRLMVLLSRIPYPLEKGDKLRAFYQLKHLSQEHEIILCCLTDSKPHAQAKEKLLKYCKNVYFIRLNKFKIFMNVLRSLGGRNPLQTYYFYQKDAQNVVDKIIEKHAPNHIYCQLLRVTEYVNKYSFINKTLDYMDCLSAGMKRRAAKSNMLLRPIFKEESKRLKYYEAKVFDFYKHKTIISEQDRLEIDHPLKNKIEVVANGIDTEFFSSEHIQSNVQYELVFTGNMAYPPNIDCALFIAQEILPIVRKKYPKIKLLISGANPVSKIKKLKSEFIHVSGWVDDIRNSYAQGKIFLAPLQLGSGLQNKLLEAMSMKIPCITSTLANGALKAKPNEEILIAQNAQEYAQCIYALLEDMQLYQKVSENGHRYVQQNFSWKASVDTLNKIIRNTQDQLIV